MTLTEMYEKVNLVMPLEQRRFFNYLEDGVLELAGMYEDKFLFDSGENSEEEFVAAKVLSDDFPVKPLYHGALVDNVLFLAGAGEAYKGEFLRKARSAYLTYWNENAKGRREKRMRW